MFEVQGLDHVALAVRDAEASAAWYQRVLGLERRFEDQWGGSPAMVGKGNTCVALFSVGTPNPAILSDKKTIAMRHFALRVDRANFDRARVDLADQGIECQFEDHGISHSIYFDDPDGHEVELTTYEV